MYLYPNSCLSPHPSVSLAASSPHLPRLPRSLRLEAERLGASLCRAEQQESQLRERLQGLSAQLSESSTSVGAAQEQAAQLQRALTASEHDRRMLQVRGYHSATTELEELDRMSVKTKINLRSKINHFLLQYLIQCLLLIALLECTNAMVMPTTNSR